MLPSVTILIGGPNYYGPWNLLGNTPFNALQTFFANLKTQGLARLLTQDNKITPLKNAPLPPSLKSSHL